MNMHQLDYFYVISEITMAKGIMQPPPARYLDSNHKPISISHLWELNEDCLTKLFAFLSNDDLKYLAQIHPAFLDVASTILIDRWQKIGIDTIYVDFGTNTDDILNFPTLKHIHVTHQTLQTFGHCVKKLYCAVRDEAIISGLIKFCSNLEELTIEGAFNNSSGSNSFSEPLIYLKKLQFIRGELSCAITQFKSWCPNIKYLEFVMIYNMADHDCIHFHFPHLKHFIVESASPFKTEDIQMMLAKNPQIEVLQITGPHFDGESFNFLCNNFESIKNLKIRLIRGFKPVFMEQERLHKLKRVKEVEVDCWHHWSSTLLLVSKYFPNINTLTIKLLDGNEIFIPTDDIESFNVMPNLKKLNLLFDVPRDDQLDLLLRFSSKLPSLTELDIRSNIRHIELLNQCFVNFTQLQEFLLSGRVTGYEDHSQKFNAIFHRRFNRICGDRDAAKMDIIIETSIGARYNVNKQHILRNRRIICKNLSYKKRV